MKVNLKKVEVDSLRGLGKIRVFELKNWQTLKSADLSYLITSVLGPYKAKIILLRSI